MSCLNLKLHFKQNREEKLVYWPASHVPIDPKFSTVPTRNEYYKLVAQSFPLQFESVDDGSQDEVNYFVATIGKNNKLNCRPARIFPMMTNYSFKDLLQEQEEKDSTPLTKREQLDEMKEKFGSKKTQRDLASKRKYDIQFGENEDIDQLPTIAVKSEEIETKEKEAVVGGEEVSLSTILPARNPNAKSVEEVYSLSEIINETEELSIAEYEQELMKNSMKNEFFILMAQKSSENQKNRLMAIYGDLLLQLVKLSAFQMRKADPMPTVVGDIKKHIFERFTSTKQISARNLRYIITDQNKDRIFVYVLIIFLMLNNFKPIELEKLQTWFGVNQNHLRRLLELIGCYIENMKSNMGVLSKVAQFRLPLNVYKDPKNTKKMKRYLTNK